MLEIFCQILKSVDEKIELADIQKKITKSGYWSAKSKGKVWGAIRFPKGINFPEITSPLKTPECVMCINTPGYKEKLKIEKELRQYGWHCQDDGVAGQSTIDFRLNVWRYNYPDEDEKSVLSKHLDNSYLNLVCN